MFGIIQLTAKLFCSNSLSSNHISGQLVISDNFLSQTLRPTQLFNCSETDSSTIANIFLSKKFEGDKARFQLFEEEIKMALLSEIGEYGVTFLITDWPIDPDTNKPVYDHRYTMKPQLVLLQGGDAE